MDKTYHPSHIEPHWTSHWESQHYYQPSGSGSSYSIALPPPNVTGTLHMGHGFQHTLMDALTRRARMQGKHTLWQGGTDHAGIATQMVVERQLAADNLSRHDLGRNAFVDKVWEWKAHSGSIITNQMRRLGTSIDWSRERFSMDEGLCNAVNQAFLTLYEEGLIYRGQRLVNWDPKLHTAISDLEVINKEQQGSLWHIKYPLVDSDHCLIVATTRPETLLGDSAVAVHPEDERYRHFIGKDIQLPLTDRTIPIIADEYVDKAFGTGCVKITPGHDFNDYEVGLRHELPMHTILTHSAHLNDTVAKAYQGLDVISARKKVVADLEQLGLLAKTEAHTLSVPYGDRSGAVIEPLLTDQWFIKMDTLAKPAMDAVDQGELEFIPANWKKTYLQWLENIQDWCISRQLWWGHRIPVWYDANGNHYVGLNEQDTRARHHLDDNITLTQDHDVLDTWFSASLWPFATLGWPEKTPELDAFYPTSVLVTGFDIIFFWVARMVMMGLKLMGKVPFKQVYITGLIRDSHGQKMSKSKGNVLDPIDIIDGITLDALLEKRTASMMQPQMKENIIKQTKKEFPTGIPSFGTDALRFTFCAMANTGRDINFDLARVAGYRNFCNKIWNAARFVFIQCEDKTIQADASLNTVADQWILSELQLAIERVNKAFDEYRFDLASQALYEFIWNEYCDWYLELSKTTLNANEIDEATKANTRYVLLTVLETTLRLAHPMMPFITEEIWQHTMTQLQRDTTSIMLENYPAANKQQIDNTALDAVTWLKAVITQIRNVRGEMNISPAKKIPLIFSKGTKQDKQHSESFANAICALAKIESLTWQDENLPPCATTLVKQLECHIPLAGFIDKDAELSRLHKALQKLQADCEKFSRKLENENYINKAPAAVVEKERERLNKAKIDISKLQAQVDRIEAL